MSSSNAGTWLRIGIALAHFSNSATFPALQAAIKEFKFLNIFADGAILENREKWLQTLCWSHDRSLLLCIFFLESVLPSPRPTILQFSEP